MPTQQDMFDPEPDPDITQSDPENDNAGTTPRLEPLAAPCGFRDQRNQPCARLASRPLSIDGVQLVSRGTPMLLCDPACFRGASTPTIGDNAGANGDVEHSDDPDAGRDPEDPGYDDTWGHGEWERDDG